MEEFFENIDTLSKNLEIYKKNKKLLTDKINKLDEDPHNKITIDLIIKQLKIINQSIGDINEKMEELQYEIDLGKINPDKEEMERIYNYEKYEKIKKLLIPYLLYLYLTIE